MSQTQAAATKNTAGTVSGFKVTMMSLLGLVVAALALREVALVYMMVLVPSAVGIVVGIAVGALDLTPEGEALSLPIVTAIALVADIGAILVVIFFL